MSRAGRRPVALSALLCSVLATATSAATVISLKASIGAHGANGSATLVTTTAGSGTTSGGRQAAVPRGRATPSRSTPGRAAARASSRSPRSGARAPGRSADVCAHRRPGGRSRRDRHRLCPDRRRGTRPVRSFRSDHSDRRRQRRTTIKVPASPPRRRCGAPAHRLAFEPWTPAPDDPVQPGRGNVFVTALVNRCPRARWATTPFDYRVSGSRRSPVRPSRSVVSLPCQRVSCWPGESVAGWLTFGPCLAAGSLILVYRPSTGTTVLIKLTPRPATGALPVCRYPRPASRLVPRDP